jgi:hypothetical protein
VDADDPPPDDHALLAVVSDPSLVIVRTPDEDALHPRWRALADVVVERDDEHRDMVANVDARPRAAIALALLMRGSDRRSLPDGLVAESMTYSLLQAGPEFAEWRSTRPVAHRPPPTGPVVLVERHDDVLAITLNRPEVRNALDRRLRDELLDALAIAAADPSLRVELRGAGSCYSSGGDLDEFGSRSDPATAHLIRLERSVGRVVALMRERVVVHLHGRCYGSGVEIPAFAGTVVAHADTRFGLPELGLGLVPGAGGTVSVTARIGRHRTAGLVLSGRAIDAPTALAWGLVDEIAG